MFDWKSVFRHWFGPKEYIKRRCPIDGFPMYEEQGVYRCPKGHILDPNKRLEDDPVMKASRGHKSGEI